MHSISLLSWNVQVGRDSGLFANNWPSRKALVVEQICKHSADIVCLQEPVWEQLTYIQKALTHFEYVGSARDDAGKKGEFCPILIDTRKLFIANSGTFWLSDTPDECHQTWDFPFKRICTWAQITEIESNNSFCVFNAHFPLNIAAHEKSSSLIAKKKLVVCRDLPGFIAADFNCDPNIVPARLFQSIGMRNCATIVGREREPTITLFGKPLTCVDAVFASTGISILSYEIIGQDSEPLASDHYGILLRADLAQ
jgi:endonuclease/exonuclease/phosphatase family metal-dependent hydrolase